MNPLWTTDTEPAALPRVSARLAAARFAAGFAVGFVPVLVGMVVALAPTFREWQPPDMQGYRLAFLALLVSPAVAGAAWRGAGIAGCLAGIIMASLLGYPLAAALAGGIDMPGDTDRLSGVLGVLCAPISLGVGLVAWGARAMWDRARQRRTRPGAR